MAVSIAVLDSGVGAADPFNTASITWSGGLGLILVASAYNGAGTVSHVATKSGDTWTTDVNLTYGERRGASYISNSSPTNGVISINPSSTSGTYQDSVYFVLEISGSDGVFPANIDNAGSGPGTGPVTITLTDSIDSGDLAVIFGCSENTAGHAVDGVTLVGSVTTSSNTRSALVGETTSDTTPGHTWTGTNYSGLIACVFNVSAAGGGIEIFRRRIEGY